MQIARNVRREIDQRCHMTLQAEASGMNTSEVRRVWEVVSRSCTGIKYLSRRLSAWLQSHPKRASSRYCHQILAISLWKFTKRIQGKTTSLKNQLSPKSLLRTWMTSALAVSHEIAKSIANPQPSINCASLASRPLPCYRNPHKVL